MLFNTNIWNKANVISKIQQITVKLIEITMF